jgi:hypothetical protein
MRRTPLKNAQWVREAASAIRKGGGEPASAAEIRTALAAISGPRL